MNKEGNKGRNRERRKIEGIKEEGTEE